MIVKARNLRKAYGNVRAVDGLSLEGKEGEIYGLLGPNGSGKTTIFRLLTGMIKPAKNSVLIWGKDVNDYSRKELVRYVSALPSAEIIHNEVLRVQDYLELARYPYLSVLQSLNKIDYSIIENAKKITQIQRLANKYLWELSQGELARVRIARVLAQDSKIIIMDEPTAHLDIDHKLWFLGALRRLKSSGKTVVTIIHDINLAYRFSDEIMILNEGRIEFLGFKEDIDLRLLEKVFNVKVRKVHNDLLFEETF